MTSAEKLTQLTAIYCFCNCDMQQLSTSKTQQFHPSMQHNLFVKPFLGAHKFPISNVHRATQSKPIFGGLRPNFSYVPTDEIFHPKKCKTFNTNLFGGSISYQCALEPQISWVQVGDECALQQCEAKQRPEYP